ncbi:MAG: hypothetical protein A2V66_17505 [Ignavibacteria bacterium RBG_13_36_8]|nr:MAG: hypothetical protein A2V66_17505 [Ignavibacteria bacterium RBG_13_36_8]
MHLPIIATVYPFYTCNLKCHCCFTEYATSDVNSTRIVTNPVEFSNRLKNLGIKVVELLGGEPFLNREFLYRFIDKCEENNIGIILSTNGTLINNHDIKFIKSKSLLKIQISIDSFHESINMQSRNADQVTKVRNTLRLFEKNNICYQITTVANKANLKCLTSTFLVELNKLSFLERLHIIRILPSSNELLFENLRISNKEYFQLIQVLQQNEDEMNFTIGIDSSYEFHNQEEVESLIQFKKIAHSCEAGRYQITISPNGDILACDMLSDSVFSNIFIDSKDDFLVKWNSSDILKKFRERDFFNSEVECSNCNALEICGSCLFLCEKLNNEPISKSPYCLIDFWKNK